MGKGRTPETAKIAARSPLQGAEDFRRCSIRSNPHRGRYTSPALTAASPPPLWTCRTETPCVASCFRPTSVISSCGASSGVDRKMIYSKKNLKNHKMVKLQSEFVIYQKP